MTSVIIPPVIVIAVNLLSLAQSGEVNTVTPLINVGVAGFMLLWFMFRTEPRLKSIEESQVKASFLNQEALDRVARSNLLLVISNGLKPFQDQAQAIIVELDEAAKKRQEMTKK